MSTYSLGTHLSLSPMSTQPSKKGRDHDGHAPSRPENNITALVEHKSAKTRTREQGDVK